MSEIRGDNLNLPDAKRNGAFLSAYHKDGMGPAAGRLIRQGFSLLGTTGTVNAVKKYNPSIEIVDVATRVDPEALQADWASAVTNFVLDAIKHNKQDNPAGPPLDLVYIEPARISGRGEPNDELFLSGISTAADMHELVVTNMEDLNSLLQWMEAGRPREEYVRRSLGARAWWALAHRASVRSDQIEHYLSEEDDTNPKQLEASLDESKGGVLNICNYTQLNGEINRVPYRTEFVAVVGAAVFVAEMMEAARFKVPIVGMAAKKNKHVVSAAAMTSASGNEAGKSIAHWMIESNPEAVFQGTLLFNCTVTPEIVDTLLTYKLPKNVKKRRLDTIYAPGITGQALDLLIREQQDVEVFTNGGLGMLGAATRKGIEGSYDILAAATMRAMDVDYRMVGGPVGDEEGQKAMDWLDFKGRQAGVIFAAGICLSGPYDIVLVDEDYKFIGGGMQAPDAQSAADMALRFANANGQKIDGAYAFMKDPFPRSSVAKSLTDAGVKRIIAPVDGREKSNSFKLLKAAMESADADLYALREERR